MRMARLTGLGGRPIAVMPTAVAWVEVDRESGIPPLTVLNLLAPMSTWEGDGEGGGYAVSNVTMYLAMTLDEVVAELDAALRRETKDG